MCLVYLVYLIYLIYLYIWSGDLSDLSDRDRDLSDLSDLSDVSGLSGLSDLSDLSDLSHLSDMWNLLHAHLPSKLQNFKAYDTLCYTHTNHTVINKTNTTKRRFRRTPTTAVSALQQENRLEKMHKSTRYIAWALAVYMNCKKSTNLPPSRSGRIRLLQAGSRLITPDSFGVQRPRRSREIRPRNF